MTDNTANIYDGDVAKEQFPTQILLLTQQVKEVLFAEEYGHQTKVSAARQALSHPTNPRDRKKLLRLSQEPAQDLNITNFSKLGALLATQYNGEDIVTYLSSAIKKPIPFMPGANKAKVQDAYHSLLQALAEKHNIPLDVFYLPNVTQEHAR